MVSGHFSTTPRLTEGAVVGLPVWSSPMIKEVYIGILLRS
jgi:hypothetical protein